MSTRSTIDDEAHRQDLAAYWAVHQRVDSEVVGRVLETLPHERPDLASALESSLGDRAVVEHGRRLVDEAMRQGDWGPYRDWLAETGRTYAALGLEFSDWFYIVHAHRREVVPHLVEAYQDDADRLAAAIRGKAAYYDLALATIGEAYLEARERTIAKQQAAIGELSTPVLRIRQGLLLMPVVGVIDTARSRQLTEALLRVIRTERAQVVVMDITGVVEVDSEVANRLLQASEAARLMGATPILTGISSGVAQTLVALGVDLKGLLTLGDLESGVQRAEELLRSRGAHQRTNTTQR